MKFSRFFIASLAMAGLMYGCGSDSEEESGAPVPETTAELCSDGIDNDGDGLKDCDVDTCKQFCNSGESDKECTDAMPSGKTCTCDKTIGQWANCTDNGGGEKDCTSAMPSGKTCTCDKATGEWTNCTDNGGGEKDCTSAMPAGQTCTCDKTTGQWTNCTNNGGGEKDCTSAMPSGKTCTCDKATGEWTNCQDNGGGEKDCTTAMPSGKTCTCDKSTGEWTNCTDNGGEETDNNGNHLKDSKESATIKESKNCDMHSQCTSSGFCDSFIGKCATRCNETSDCMDGYICRPDGRCAAEAFETVWRISAANEELTMPVSDGVCDYKIDWGDGSAAEEYHQCPEYGKLKHKYTAAGNYRVKITGTYSDWCMGEGHIGASCMPVNDVQKLTEVVSYGPVGLSSNAFASAKNLEKLPIVDIPDATLIGCQHKNTQNCGELWDMFYSCEKLKSGLANWDVSNVTQMHNMFAFAKVYDESLNKWDTSNITNMEGMFLGAEKFNGNIDKWDTSKVTGMHSMFEGAETFNQDISGWKTSKVTSMVDMFKDAIKFAQNLSDWDMHSIENMAGMFDGATAYSKAFSTNQSRAASKITSCDKVKKSFEGTAVSCDDLKNMRKNGFLNNLVASCTVKDLKSTCSAN